jgi:hypothetical protein
MTAINSIIEALGYSNSKNLYYNKNQSDQLNNNYSLRKIIEALDPVAYYCLEDKPFILFFECPEKNLSSELNRKIWNAQIPLSIIVFENRIEIFNGCSLNIYNELILLETIAETNQLSETSSFSYWNLSSASFWEDHIANLSAAKLDAVMLENIKDVTNKLKQSACEPFAVQLVLRLIFIRYLIDRGTDLDYRGLNGNVEQSQQRLLELLQTKEELYCLFLHLKNKFNGNLFEIYEENLQSEMDLIDTESLQMLHDLMAGNLVLSSGQTSLFPMYDFNIIPVELISNIYERFLGDENQKKDKAFYTPPYLVDYLLKDTIEPFLSDNTSCKILDPACGSGIFLVESARKIIENKTKKSFDGFDDQDLVSSITDNLWGIDKNPEAINVAVFSIYLTILDYKDPKTLKDFKLPLLKEHNFFVADFFSEQVDEILRGKTFDFIIGNPPWGSVSGEHVRYCLDRELPIQNNEISRSFVLRTKDFANEDTCCCLIVTSKLFYNTQAPARDFRKWLLEKAKIHKYIELAAVRELIFTKVRGPAGVITYAFNSDQKQNEIHEMTHLTLKPNIFFKLFNIIAIEKNDYKYFPQSLLIENDWAWKTVIFGYTNDFHTIKHLEKSFASVMDVIKDQGLLYGTGIRVADGDKQDASHLKGRWLIDAQRGVRPFQVNSQCGYYFEKDKVHRPKADMQYLFKAPFALIKKGFDTQTYKFRAAYSEEDFLYTDAITGICGNKKDILLSFVGLFNSSFYAYCNLMLGSSSGIEREQGFPTEIFKYPALVDDKIASLVESIQIEISKEQNMFSNSHESERLIADLDSVILKKFGLDDNLFVDYALNIQIPMIVNNQLTWDKVSSQQLKSYANIIIEYFNKIFASGERYIVSTIYNNIMGHYSAIEFTFQDTKPVTPVSEVVESNNAYMALISKFMLNEINDLFYQMRDVISFKENSFFILKTDEYKNWHPAMAKLDLTDVLNEIFTGEEANPV